MSSSDNILTVIVLGAVAYIILTTKQTATGTAAATEKAYQASCNYLTPLTLPWFACKMGAYPKPSATPGTEHSPQTPPPKPTPKTEYCTYDPLLLAGDIRCSPQLLPKIQECPEGTFPTWYGTCEAGARHL